MCCVWTPVKYTAFQTLKGCFTDLSNSKEYAKCVQKRYKLANGQHYNFIVLSSLAFKRKITWCSET